MSVKTYEVKGYTKTGIYAEYVQVPSSTDACITVMAKLKARYPGKRFTRFVAKFDDQGAQK